MSIDLPDEFANFVEQEVASGRFESAADVICHSLNLLRDREQRLENLRRELQIGIDQIERGEYVEISTPEELDAFFADIEQQGMQRLESNRQTCPPTSIQSESS